MEGVETVDVSWLLHSQRGELGAAQLRSARYHLSRCKSASSVVCDKTIAETEVPTTQRPIETTASPDRNPSASPAPSKATPQRDGSKPDKEVKQDDKAVEEKPTGSSPASQKSAPRPVGARRNSWISSLSSKFSSGSTPPSQSNMKAPPTTKATPPASKMDMHNPFGAAYSPKDKEEEKKDENSPFGSASPKGPSFLQSAFRKLSSSASGGAGKMAPNGTICQRRVMNIDQDRDRCKIPDLNAANLRRVAFCVDVEIAGISYRESDEDSPPASTKRRVIPEAIGQKHKRSNSKSKEKDEAVALKNPQAAVCDKEKSAQKNGADEKGSGTPEAVSNEVNVNGESKEPTRKQEKKKRSEEERRERREKKRRQAEANGTIPMQLTADGQEYGLRTPASTSTRSKTTSHPTTDPVRIYRRCCQLRETPVLKRIVDEISSPSSTLAESPGTVAVLDLSDFPMTSEDIATFCDWLAVVPVRKLILEKCALTDSSVRSILAGLLSTRTVEHMTNRRKRGKNLENTCPEKEERFSVVEKLSLKDNPKIGSEGWSHICLFIHLSQSLKAIDLSGLPLPKALVAANGFNKVAPRPPNASNCTDATTLFANSLSQRLGGDHLEELLLSECKPTTEDVKKICDAAAAVGLRRLGFANNELGREGLEHIASYLKAGKCEGLDLGGNPIQDHLDLITSALSDDHPLYALSLADCSLTPSVVYPLFQGLTRLPDLRFIDFSHNPDLFTMQPDALATFRRCLPNMPALKRIHLADVNLSPDQIIALAEVLPESPSLCHLNILENPLITTLASATDPASQEEACAVYASLMAAVRVSRTIIAVDIEVPTAESNEVVKALASQIVAYSLHNLEQGAIAVEFTDPTDTTTRPVHVPEILQHIVGHSAGDEPEDDDEPAADEDYVIGGTGVVKALGVCLGNVDCLLPGEQSGPPSGTTTPRHRKSRSLVAKRPRDMSINLLSSARNIRTRIQSALVREDRAGNDTNYRRLQFLDFTLQRMIQRFEDEYPETRIIPQTMPSYTMQDTSSQNSGDDGPGFDSIQQTATNGDAEVAGDDEEDNYGARLSRASSVTSLHSRAMTSEEGHIHRLGQGIRRDFLSPSFDQTDDDFASYSFDESHMAALRDKLDRLQEDQTRPPFESVGSDKAFEDLGTTVEELFATRKHDTETFERFRQSQIAAQINSGKRSSSTMPDRSKEINPAKPDQEPSS
ncbi:cell wall biogenesis protein Mhp1 [Aspergillus heteromorphus CBS 117.55]|uniref:Cell wall biogenesis protein Mhp1 n=1 Tax=Aspergillus heteromorphus CBS 117.55 TaxID=1448321 RepID=A0A317W000_9EURO|nr:cell wall biogenesis protein Mhp1 [Aspergillus heteromorphus CBS 117.55]PWY77470.1 cell wall biogenesis protein Mhp1 [Aspergillus heteromorphus CBS 117.55]